MPALPFTPLLPLTHDHATPYRRLTADHVGTFTAGGRTFLEVAPEALTLLTREAMRDIAHLLRPAHLAQLRRILDDAEASPNDRFVALDLLKNANIAAGGVLPMCQDTGTAIVMGKKGQLVLTPGDGDGDEAAIARGVHETYAASNLRYSQLAPLTMYEERNTGTNLPAQIELYATGGDEYRFLFMAKGGGSANKSYLFQETKALLNPASLMAFLGDKLRALGTAACPPYHLAIVVGGTSAEHALKTAKLASAHYLDGLPTSGSALGHGFRDLELEAAVWQLSQATGIGAQFGGKYFCHDVRVVRLPRHGASCPVAIAVSCSADRQAVGKITKDGVFLEQLEHDPAQYLPEPGGEALGGEVVRVDLTRPMSEIRAELTRYPIKTRLSLTGPLVVARDIAHAKLKERLDAGGGLPAYFKDHAVYYAGPAKTPTGMASGSFGPTTAGRMDSYVDLFQRHGGSLVMLAKGNRSRAVTDACKAHGGFYLGSIGGPAARLAQDCIKHVEVLEYAELGMEAVWKIDVVDFPAFIVVDDKGHDFFAELGGAAKAASLPVVKDVAVARVRVRPAEALERLRSGNARFVADLRADDKVDTRVRRAELVAAQQPFAIVLGCSDSRVPAEIVFDQGLGDLFVIRVAGNIVAPSQLGSIEFAAERFGTPLVLVMGHTRCGAITATVDACRGRGKEASINLGAIVQRIRPAVEPLCEASPRASRATLIAAGGRANVRAAVNQVRHGSGSLEALEAKGRLMVVGAEYDLATGEVDFFDVPRPARASRRRA